MDISLSDRARNAARRHRIPEAEVRRARHGSRCSNETAAFLIVDAELADGRRIRMRCNHEQPGQIVSIAVL